LELFDILSPCRDVCQANRSGYCIGCYRSRQERLQWVSLSNQEKRLVLRKCQQRKARALREKKLALTFIVAEQASQTLFE
ncbi:MAG: DUF1289 domain-containing protein, partial [Neisseriaceae bacterium]